MTLPSRTHLVHKPIELRNLSPKVLQDIDIYDPKQYVWEYKYDGCCTLIVVSGDTAKAYSRQGKPVFSLDHLLPHMARMPDGVYFGEAYHFNLPHSEINGMYRKQSVQEDLQLVLFDFVHPEEFATGHSPRKFMDRRAELWGHFTHVILDAHYAPTPCITMSTMFRPDRIEENETLIANLRKHYKLELDGFVAKRRDGEWYAGSGKGGEQVKVKDVLSLDLKVVDVVEGEGKFAGAVGSLIVEDSEGKRFSVSGGRLTLPERVSYLRSPSQIVGSVVEVHALGLSQHGDLREARFQRVRYDKDSPDKV